MTTAGIEPATFRIVAQHLNHCATAVPLVNLLFTSLEHFVCLFVVEQGSSNYSGKLALVYTTKHEWSGLELN